MSNGIHVNTDAKTVTRDVSTKRNREDSSPVKQTWVFDFSDTPDEDVLEWASRTVTIKHQQNLRENPEEFGKDGETIRLNASEVMEARDRAPADPIKKARNALSRLSDEEREALLASL